MATTDDVQALVNQYNNNAMSSSLNKTVMQKFADSKGIPVEQVIDYIFSRTSFGSVSTAIGNMFMGFNHRNTPSLLPMNRDTNGYVFFTRPDVNLKEVNIRQSTTFNQLRNTDSYSLGRIIRCTLDPDLMKGTNTPEGKYSCPVLDPLQVFIPMLSNTCTSVSGFGDIETPLYTTKPGAYGETMCIVDGHSNQYGPHSITTTHRNTPGSPILQLIYYWIKAATEGREGKIGPDMSNVFEYRKDYETAIYRIITDHTKQYVENIARTGFSIPKGVPIGSVFNFELDKPFNQANNEFTITWEGHGIYYQHDLIVRTFNASVALMNPGMDPSVRANNYVKIPREYLTMFNHRGYPYIDPNTRELQWFISKNELNMMVSNPDSYIPTNN